MSFTKPANKFKVGDHVVRSKDGSLGRVVRIEPGGWEPRPHWLGRVRRVPCKYEVFFPSNETRALCRAGELQPAGASPRVA